MQNIFSFIGLFCKNWEVNTRENLWQSSLELSFWVDTISRLLKMLGLFCRIPSLLQGPFAKETIILRSLLIVATLYTPEIHQIQKLKFLGTSSNSTRISIWICTARYRDIEVSRFGGFWECGIFSGNCRGAFQGEWMYVRVCVCVCVSVCVFHKQRERTQRWMHERNSEVKARTYNLKCYFRLYVCMFLNAREHWMRGEYERGFSALKSECEWEVNGESEVHMREKLMPLRVNTREISEVNVRGNLVHLKVNASENLMVYTRENFVPLKVNSSENLEPFKGNASENVMLVWVHMCECERALDEGWIREKTQCLLKRGSTELSRPCTKSINTKNVN